MRNLIFAIANLALYRVLFAQEFHPGEGFTQIPINTWYKIHGYSAGDSPRWGDHIRMTLAKFQPDGQLMFSTSMLNMSDGVEMELLKDGWEGDVTDVFLLMHRGDSATVYVPVWVADKDSSQMASQEYYRFEIKLMDFISKEDHERRKAERLALLRVREMAMFDSIVQLYPGQAIKRLSSGVTIIKTFPQKGKTFRKGEVASVHYRLRTIWDDRVLDNSYTRGKPFRFLVGEGQVIKGWDEAFLHLKKREKAIVLVPSWMAYGERGAGEEIAPDTPLIFEIEVMEVP